MSDTSRSIWRRRQFFINRGLQGRFVIGFAAAVLVGFFFNLLFSYFVLDQELTAALYRSHLKIRSTAQIALPVLAKLGAATTVIIFAISAAVGYYLLRRVERPIESFRGALRRLADGDTAYRLPGDHIPDLSGAYNGAASSLHDRFAALSDCFEAIDREAAALRAADRPEAVLKALDTISEKRKQAEEELSGFRL